MRNPGNLLVITLAALSVLVLGCGGSGTKTYGASGAPYFAITTNYELGSSPTYEAWPNATITGYADTNSLAYYCVPANDSSCIADIGNASPYAITQNEISAFNTNGSGLANFATDAIGAEWYFYATDNGSSQCNGGAALLTTITGESSGAIVTLTCGSNAADMVATPSGCADDHSVEPPTSDCPASVTLTFPPPVSSSESLPVATALTTANYDSSGDNLAQNSVTASTTTSVVVPTPTTYGTTYLGVYNSSGSLIGVSEFTRTYIPPASHGTSGCTKSPCTEVVGTIQN